MYAIRVHEHGGPEVLRYEEVDKPVPGPGRALVKVAAVGVNFTEIYSRGGAGASSALPYTPGSEAAGTVEAVGDGVSEVKPGDRVAANAFSGAYADYAVAPAARLVQMPPSLDWPQAAAALLQGMTAHYLTHSSYAINRGDTVLVHAAAGGTGLLMVQMAKMRGARVLGTVSTPEKAALAREAGADETILYTKLDFAAEVRRLTNGEGVHAVYDSVGKDTFDGSLNCLRTRGTLVLFGQASGPIPLVDSGLLNSKGSLYLTRVNLGNHIATRDDLLARANDVLNWTTAGKLTLSIGGSFPLARAAEAHRQLESRATTGKLVLIP
jgi:NADPH:quinone reductase